MSTVNQDTTVIDDKIPTDDEINAAYDTESGTNGVNKSEETPDLAKPDAAETKPDGVVDDSKADGVASKNGKHILPFEVLEKNRQELADERAARAADNEKFEAMQAELEALKSGKASVDTSKFYSDEDLELMAESQPSVAEFIRDLQSTVVNVSAQSKQVEAKQVQQAQASLNQQMQDAIDSSPLLTALQIDKDITGWNRAAVIDQILMADPEFASKSIAERMAETEKLYVARYGNPDAKSSKETDKVKEALAKADQGATSIKSISDLAGGATPGSEDVEFANQSAPAMADKFANMTTAQMDAYIARTIA